MIYADNETCIKKCNFRKARRFNEWNNAKILDTLPQNSVRRREI